MRVGALMPDYIGFIFYQGSPRYAGATLKPDFLEGINERIKKVGVFVGEDMAKVYETVITYGLDAVQLHGDESVEYCSKLREKELEVIKAFFIENEADFGGIEKYVEVCNYFLFDNRGSTGGGSGKKFNWEILQAYNMDKPFFLSGGIGPDDAAKVTQIVNPYLYAVDINSRFETEPGIKDIGLVKKFMNQLK